MESRPVFQGQIWGVLPSDFPTDKAESIYRRFINEMDGSSRACRLMGFAFKGVAYRFKSMVHHGLNYEKSLTKNGSTPPVDVEFEQEHSLFSFFASGMSAIECFFFALHAIGAHYAPGHFKLQADNLRNVSPKSVTESFEVKWPIEAITQSMRHLIDLHEFIIWARVRNILIHRAVPPKTIIIQPGHSTKAIWQIEDVGIEDANQMLGEINISSWREWMSGQFHMLWAALEGFHEKRVTG